MRLKLTQILAGVGLILLAGIACAQDQNLLPKYGSLSKSQALKDADATFISEMDKQYHGDRGKASEDMATRGWQYLYKGNFDDAMRRFNQAWLLNHKNGIALWGMGAVEANSEHFDSSLKLFAEAEPLVGDNTNFSVDYAKVVGMTGITLKDDALIKVAFDRFQRIYQKAPQNTNNLQNWAIALFLLGRYSDAWEKVKLAEATPDKNALDPSFIKDLESHMPRPKD